MTKYDKSAPERYEKRKPNYPEDDIDELIKELPRDTAIIELFKKINADPLPAR